ncbi:MAG: alginate export family protein [Verrucomicrobiota bacterium]
MTKHKTIITALSMIGAASIAGGAFFDIGEAPPKWENAKPNTELGKDILGIAGEPALQGRLIYNQRLRYEFADQQNLEQANAFTLRTRIGYETPKLYGMYFLGEFENTWAINYQDYRAFPQPQFPAAKTVIADPRNNQLNQLFFGFKAYNSEFKAGRQGINLDNQRFVGTVAWRQNDQTYDAIRFTTKIITDVWLSYVWDWQVNRIFGEYATVPNQRRFNSNNHFVNLHYTGIPWGTAGAYFYYVDLDGAAATSGSTAGLFFNGKVPLAEDWSLPFRAEYAFQTNNPGTSGGPNNDFFLNYIHAKLGVNYTGKYEIGFGFESLGGNNTRAFQTPLATLHKFNGWNDVFLFTPVTATGSGLQDYYVYFKAGLPWKIGFFGAYHYFTAENTSRTYGQEIDVGLKRAITENVSVLTKFGYYDGHGGAAAAGGLGFDRTKFWVQVDFKL